jgi:hypothetical protein
MIARKRSATIVLMLTAAAAACTSGDVESAEAPGDVGLAGAQTIESAVPTPDDGAALRYVVAPGGTRCATACASSSSTSTCPTTRSAAAPP